MGDLKRGAKRLVGGVGDFLSRQFESMKEGSKEIAEVLGYGKAGITPASDKTKRAMEPPPVAPMPDIEEQQRARRRRVAGASRTGRVATILTNDYDTLG